MSCSSPVVVGYRTGASGIAALRYAAGLADGLVAEMHVVHVTDLDDYPLDPAEALHRLAARSIGRELLCHAQCPVLVVPCEQAR